MKKSIYVLLLSLVVILSGCSQNINIVVPTEKKPVYLDIMVTNKCLYTMVKDIAGNNNIDYMFKDENKMQDFTYTQDSLQNTGKQDLFIYNGADFEKWTDDFLGNVDKSKVGVINVSRGVSLLTYNNKDSSNYRNRIPYYWIDSDNYKVMLLNIKNAIEEKDPGNRDIYESNFENAIKNINKYKKGVDEISNQIKQYTFISDSDNFDYLLNKYNNFEFYRNNQGSISADDLSKIQKEMDNGKKLCFVYSDDKDLQQNKDIIDKFKMKTLKIILYDGDMSYLDILQNNFAAIKKVVQ